MKKRRGLLSITPPQIWSITPDHDDGLPRSLPSVVTAMQKLRFRCGAAISTRLMVCDVIAP